MSGFFVLLFLLHPPVSPAEDTRALGLGEQTSLTVEPGTRFSVGNPEVILVRPTQLSGGRSLLLVKGKSQGYSDLILLDAGGVRRSLSFRVVSKRQAALAGDGQRLFPAGSGIELRASGDGWLAKGTVRNLEDWNAARALEAGSQGRLRSIAKLHPLERARAESRIRRRFREAGLAGLGVHGAGSTVVVTGDAPSPAAKELAETLAREVIQDARSEIRVPFEKGARLRFHARILEVLRENAASLGLRWGEGVPGALQVTKSLARADFALDAALQLLERSGKARLLAQPQLVLNEKGVAELQVGGEIPVPLRTRAFSAVQWKPYGLTLRLELPGVSGSLARTHIAVEISTLDPGNGADGVPALRVSKMDTQVDMEVGKPLLLSGLLESRQSRSVQGLPLLGDIPVLGELFRSKDFRENRSELVILLEAGS